MSALLFRVKKEFEIGIKPQYRSWQILDTFATSKDNVIRWEFSWPKWDFLSTEDIFEIFDALAS